MRHQMVFKRKVGSHQKARSRLAAWLKASLNAILQMSGNQTPDFAVSCDTRRSAAVTSVSTGTPTQQIVACLAMDYVVAAISLQSIRVSAAADGVVTAKAPYLVTAP